MHQIEKILLILVLTLFSKFTFAAEKPLDKEIMDYLAELDFTALQKIEVSLDDTFDIFDSLVKKHHTGVATGIKQSTQRAPSVTSVITAQDIEAIGAQTLDEVLQTVPGLQSSYNFSNNPVYTIRGISTKVYNTEVLFLVNGVPLTGAATSSKSWSYPALSSIARVEIIRGPGSALYGADAFAGVVNIVTKTKQDIEGTEIGARLGNHNTQNAWMLHGNEWKGFDILTILDVSRTDGHQRIVEQDAQTTLDKLFGTHVSFAPGPYGSEFTTYHLQLDISKQHWRARAMLHGEIDKGIGVGIMQSLNPGKPHDNQSKHLNILYSNPTFSRYWGVDAQVNYQHLTYNANYLGFPPGARGGAYPIGMINQLDVFEQQIQTSLSGTYRGLDKHLVQLGVGHVNYDLYKTTDVRNYGINPFTGEMISPLELVDVSDTFAENIPEKAKSNWYGMIQDIWTINPEWELTTGIRYDHYSDFGNTTNPRLGLVWETYDDFTVKLLYGQAFRSPSFLELYSQNNVFSGGNPNLKPETMKMWELAFDYRATHVLNLTLNLFQYEVKDKIITVPKEEHYLGYANAASWKGRGGEFEMRWKTSHKSSLLFNYSYQDSEDKVTGAQLPNGSQQTAYLRGDYLLGSKWYINTQATWNNGWKREPGDPREDLKGYTTVDLVLRRKDIRAGHTNVALGINNVFNADVRYPSPGPDTRGILNVPNDLPGADRSYFVEFRYKF